MKDFLSKDTIANISTPVGKGGIGIIRVSGNKSFGILKKVFFPIARKKENFEVIFEPSKMILGKFIINKNEELDICLAVFFKAPKSYTGEDIVEFHMHGGEIILKEALREILKYCRASDPGEFTKRAFLNGKIDLMKAESVAGLIDSLTLESAKNNLQNLSGKLSKEINLVENEISDILAEVEVNLDYYDDEDLPEFDEKRIEGRIQNLKLKIQKFLDSYKVGRILKDGARVVLAGFPNAGKSTLFNKFLGFDRAIVSEIPGTTRDTLEEYFNLDGVPVKFVDTAGINEFSVDRIEKLGIARSKEEIEKADLILFLSENKKIEESIKLIEKENLKPEKILFLITKVDLEKPSSKRLEAIKSRNLEFLEISSFDDQSIKKLCRVLKEKLVGDSFETESVTISTERQKKLLDEAFLDLKESMKNIKKERLEILAENLRSSLRKISLLSGKEFTPDILDLVFKNFCVGK